MDIKTTVKRLATKENAIRLSKYALGYSLTILVGALCSDLNIPFSSSKIDINKLLEPRLAQPSNSTEAAIFSITAQTEGMWSDYKKVESAQSIVQVIQDSKSAKDETITYAINAMNLISQRVDSDLKKREIAGFIADVARKVVSDETTDI